jgi:hypothetical protein
MTPMMQIPFLSDDRLEVRFKGDVLRHVHPVHEQQNLLLVIRIVGDRLNNARLFNAFPVVISRFFLNFNHSFSYLSRLLEDPR